MAKVVWASEAELWLRRIHDFIAVDNPAAAFAVVESLHRLAEILGQFPEIGHVHAMPSTREVRILLWGHYRIVYFRRGRTQFTYWAYSTGRWISRGIFP